jgi:hypothetical protein
MSTISLRRAITLPHAGAALTTPKGPGFNCMAHCGYEATAAEAMSQQRPAQYVFDGQVHQRLSEIRANEAREKAAKAAQTSASAA